MIRKPADPELQRAATAIQLSIAITKTIEPAELGNDMYELMCNTWIRSGRSLEWISAAVDAIDDIDRIAFSKNPRTGKWVLVTEWNEE